MVSAEEAPKQEAPKSEVLKQEDLKFEEPSAAGQVASNLLIEVKLKNEFGENIKVLIKPGEASLQDWTTKEIYLGPYKKNSQLRLKPGAYIVEAYQINGAALGSMQVQLEAQIQSQTVSISKFVLVP
jgi:hypothetical protein